MLLCCYYAALTVFWVKGMDNGREFQNSGTIYNCLLILGQLSHYFGIPFHYPSLLSPLTLPLLPNVNPSLIFYLHLYISFFISHSFIFFKLFVFVLQYRLVILYFLFLLLFIIHLRALRISFYWLVPPYIQNRSSVPSSTTNKMYIVCT